MAEYKKLYNQIDKLNGKIKKLELTMDEKKQQNTRSIPIIKKIPNSSLNPLAKSTILSFRIHFPKEQHLNKKYIGLKFDDNLNSMYDSDEKSTNKNLLSFIKLTKSNIIINYTIQLELNFTPIDSIICSIAVGIRSSLSPDSKIRIIKGTKYIFDLAGPNTIDGKLNISNNVLYSAEENEELCMIADFDFNSGSNCIINSKKSIIKLLFV
jgi:hypothetical protein